MDKNSKDLPKFRLARAKLSATTKTIKLVVFLHGTLALIFAVLITAVLAPLLHMDIPLFFAGSLVGSAILLLGLSPIKSIWLSNFGMACQEEQLWDTAMSTAMDGEEATLVGILEGKYPQNPSPGLALKVSQLEVMMVRQGEMKKAARLAEYLYRDSAEGEDKLYKANSLACVLVELGQYERGFELADGTLAKLDETKRSNSPCSVTSLLALVQGHLDLERLEKAEKYLERLKGTIAEVYSKVSTNITDEYIKMEGSQSTELAFYWYFMGRLNELKGSADAEMAFKSAIDIMKTPALRKKHILFYPELILASAILALTNRDYTKAEQLAEEALKLYESDTPSTGSDYVKCKATLAYARLKLGRDESMVGDLVSELEHCLSRLEELLYEPHPSIATCMFQLGEAYIRSKETEKARDLLERSLLMRKRLLSADSPRIQQVENLLSTLPAAEPAAIS